MGLFIKKPFAALQAEANESGNKTLKRVLGPWSLIALGVGVIIGAGLFSITGTVAAGYTGPAISFIRCSAILHAEVSISTRCSYNFPLVSRLQYKTFLCSLKYFSLILPYFVSVGGSSFSIVKQG